MLRREIVVVSSVVLAVSIGAARDAGAQVPGPRVASAATNEYGMPADLMLSDAADALGPESDAIDPVSGEAEDSEPEDLTLANFFTTGWSNWAKRSRRGRTPDMALLRVTTNFLEREFRLDYTYTKDVKNNPKVDSSQFLNGLIAYGLNRRFMIEVISNYQWNEPPSGSTATKQNGSGGAALTRFQLVDTYDQSYACQVRASAPNKGIGQTATTVSPSLAGFQDMQVLLGLDRVGLYESVTYDSLSGPHKTGARTQSLSYDLSIAKTWLDPEQYPAGKLTTFLEGFATTDLNGPTEDRTAVSLTPGVRFWFAPENSIAFGVDFPVTHPHAYGQVFRITYFLLF